MLPFKTELLFQLSSSSSSSSSPPLPFHDELSATWNELAFQFDMDDGENQSHLHPAGSSGSSSSSGRRPRASDSATNNNHNNNDIPSMQDAALLAQFAAHAGNNNPASSSASASTSQQQQSFPHPSDPSYDALLQALATQYQSPSQMHNPFQQQHTHRLPHPQQGLPSFLHHPHQQQWGSDPQTMDAYNAGVLAALQGTSQQQQHFMPSGLVHHNAAQIRHQPQPLYQHQQQPVSPIIPSGPSQTSSPSGSAQDQSPDNQGEDDAGSMVDDKRRRNTAASARFRVKKKQRTLNLERQVSDLTGRAEELEREANELRRENGWLKEIVMLKGSSRYQAANPEASSSSALPPPNSTSNAVVDDREQSVDDEDDDNSGEYGSGGGRKPRKGKGKARK